LSPLTFYVEPFKSALFGPAFWGELFDAGPQNTICKQLSW